MTSEPHDIRLKRLAMRSMRRGIKEMDIILSRFADNHLTGLNARDLECYEQLLSENDHDLYAWIIGTQPTPAPYEPLMDQIRTDITHITDV
ncbi:MAG: succinate dehydrogenase assembly factor 2 [Pseudomonadota bacterium]